MLSDNGVEFAHGPELDRPIESAAQRPVGLAVRTLTCCLPAQKSIEGKQKTPRRASFNCLIFRKKIGAGEGIRTLDPDLGKVVLYP